MTQEPSGTRIPGLLRAGIVVVAAVAALALAGCARPPRVTPTASGIRWQLDVSPYRPAALRNATLRLRAFDTAGRPLALHGFRATASMPEMNHRGDTIAFREVEPGLYEAVHVFSMDGRWEIRISGVVKGERVEDRIVLQIGGGP